MIGAWTINVGGKVYGPYTSERMRAFAGEGRLAPQSLIAREGTSDWHEANDESEFASLFGAPKPAAAETSTVNGAPVNGSAANAAPTNGAPANGAPAAAIDAAAPVRAQLAIFVDVKSRISNNFEQTILDLGPACRLLPNVWIVSTPETANAVRNRLVQELGKLDSLFVIDATRGKSAWFNFGPEADVKIRRVWQKTT
jgi:hypothetical protein